MTSQPNNQPSEQASPIEGAEPSRARHAAGQQQGEGTRPQPADAQQPNAAGELRSGAVDAQQSRGTDARQSEGDVIIRERKKSRKKKSRKSKRGLPTAAKVAIGIVAVLLVIGAAAFAFIQYNVKKGYEQLHIEHPEVAETGRTVTHDGKTYRYNENVVAILVLGKDNETSYGTTRACTDANMLVTLDTETKDLHIVAIPRDAVVDVDLYSEGEYTRTAPYQLAVAYGVDVPDDDAAAKNTMKSVSKLLYNLPISRYFTLELDSIGELSTAVGGVQVQALDTYPGANFQVGDTVLLQGDAARLYVQYRDINVDKSAQYRQERQMQFVKAFVEKLRTLDAGAVLDLYNTVQQSTHTNLEFSDIAYLVSVFLGGSGANTQFMSIDGETRLEMDDDGIERERIYLDENSVMEAALAAFYTPQD